MKRLKKLAADFKAFITKGNVVDMAVAVIIGAAFSAIVTSLTNDIIMPLVNWALGGSEGAEIYTVLKAVYMLDANGEQVLDVANSIVINWSNFINKVLDFLIIALVLFTIVKTFMALKNAADGINTKAKKRAEKLTEKLKKKGLSEEEAKAQAEAQIAQEAAVAPAEPAKPSVEELLSEIRDLLAADKADKE